MTLTDLKDKLEALALAESMKAPQSLDHSWDRGYRAGAAAVWAKIRDFDISASIRPWKESVSAKRRELGRDLTLDELLLLAKDYKMTPEEIEAQRQSWIRQDMD